MLMSAMIQLMLLYLNVLGVILHIFVDQVNLKIRHEKSLFILSQ
jgi:hypothetical protein